MCVSFPTPPENRFTGTPPGPVKLFFGGLVFLFVLFAAGVFGLIRRKN